MTEFSQSYELKISPVSPETVSSVKEDVRPMIELALREAGYENLLAEGQIRVNVEQTFPTDAAMMVAVTLLSKVAYDVFKEVILPKLRSRFVVEERPKSKTDDKE